MIFFAALWACSGGGECPGDCPDNEAPSAPGIFLSPESPSAGESLVCVVEEEGVDPEGEALSYRFHWAVNGAAYVATETANRQGDSIADATTQGGQSWRCTVTAEDPQGLQSTEVSAEVSIKGVFQGWEESPLGVSEADYVFVGSSIGGQAGRIALGVGDVDGDGLGDLLINAHQNDEGGYFAGKAFLFSGADLQGPGTINLADSAYGFLGEGEEDLASHGIASAGDLDGDGLFDLLISGYLHDGSSWDVGRVYLFLAGNLGEPGDRSLEEADYRFTGEAEGDRLGHGVASAGDVDGDGFPELLTGAYGQDTSGADAGKAYLVLGSGLGAGGDYDIGDADYQFTGELPGDKAGFLGSGLGDVDGDGLDDFLFSAKLNDDGGVDAGRVYLFYGADLGAPGEYPVASAGEIFVGEGAGDICCILTEVGDVDGDAAPDLLLGSHYNGEIVADAGKVYLLLASSLEGGVVDLSEADYGFRGEAGGDEAGHGLAGAGDLDGDGLSDFLVGSAGYTPDVQLASAGKGYLVLGGDLGPPGSYNLGEVAVQSFVGDTREEYAGWGVASAGDMNGDGINDLLIGTQNENLNGLGRVFLFLTP